MEKILQDIFNTTKKIKNKGKNAKYIPALGEQDPNILGIAITDCKGQVSYIGDSHRTIPIESISKVFSLAMLLNHMPIREVNEKIGLKPSFLPFNSVMAMSLAEDHKVNPFVNNGAIATTASLCHLTEEKGLCWQNILDFFNDISYLEHPHPEISLSELPKVTKVTKVTSGNNNNSDIISDDNDSNVIMDKNIFHSEYDNSQHNLAMANLLSSWGILDQKPTKVLKTYTKQCSLKVSAQRLSSMAACLANGGVHPISGKTLIKKENVKYLLSIMLSCGLYEESAEWSVYVGVPSKSGVGGGIMMVVPGKFGIGIVSPPLNKYGNSYLGWEIAKQLSKKLNINLFK